VTAPAFLAAFSVFFFVLALFDDAENLSDISTAGALGFMSGLLLFLVFLPWLGLALIVYARSLDAGGLRTGVGIVGVTVLVVGAIPWIPAAIVVIVSPFWSP
jgi:hypothetical protein